MIPRRLATVALAVTTVLVAGCGDDADVANSTRTTAAGTSGVATTTAPTTTVAPDPAYRTWIANVRPEVPTVVVHDAPGGAQLRLDTAGDGKVVPVSLPNPLPSGAPATFRVLRRDVVANGGTWHQVSLPVRPNESAGWISASDVTLTTTDLAATIHLGEHRLDLTDAGAVVASYPVAAGRAGTPTPTGSFFVKELIETPNPNGMYGPLAYGLSAYSPTLLDTEAFKDGVIGIHGTSEPQLIGTDVSHGCVRVRNDDVLDLQRRQVPLGMPVTIVA